MKIAPKLIMDVGKQLNFLLSLWGFRSQRGSKASLWTLPSLALLRLAVELSNSFPYPAKAREEVLKEAWRSHCWLFLAPASSGGWMTFQLPAQWQLCSLSLKGRVPRNESVNCGVQLPFCCFCSVLRFEFLVIQCFCDKPLKACIWTLSILCLSFPAETLLNIMLHWA